MKLSITDMSQALLLSESEENPHTLSKRTFGIV